MPSTISMNSQSKVKASNQLNDVLRTFVLNEGNDEREHEDGRSIESDDTPKPEFNLIKLVIEFFFFFLSLKINKFKNFS